MSGYVENTLVIGLATRHQLCLQCFGTGRHGAKATHFVSDRLLVDPKIAPCKTPDQRSGNLICSGHCHDNATNHKMTRSFSRPLRSTLSSLTPGAFCPRSSASLACRAFSTSQTHLQDAASATFPAGMIPSVVDYASPTKPPSARPAETRKSQLIRTYTSLLRTTPLILFFQHSNLTAVEWAAVRRELKKAIASVPSPAAENGVDLAPTVQMQVLRTNMFNVALKISEFFNAEVVAAASSTAHSSKGPIVHDLSEAAYQAMQTTDIPADSNYAQIEPLMVGPLAALIMPAVSPAHLAAALSVLAPVPGSFPAPSRKKNPGYHEPICQNGLAKLLLVGGRIEGKIFDQTGVNWVGAIEGGMDGLRAQIVHILQGAGLGITSTLEAGGRNLWLALESRKEQLKDE